MSHNKSILLETHNQTADYNMAFDNHLLNSLVVSEQEQFWRIYSWNPAAISIGKNQNGENVLDLDKISVEGVKVVKRPTGGRAIYHKKDICISTAGLISSEQSLGTAARDIYLHFADILKSFLKNLKVRADLARGSRLDRMHHDGPGKLPCFLSATPYELVSSGKKIAGIALFISKDRYLVQSSIKRGQYEPDDFRFFRGLRSSRSMYDGLTSLEQETGRFLTQAEIKEAIIEALKYGAGLELVEMDPDYQGIT